MQLTTQMYHQGQITYKQKINVSMIALLVQVLFCYNGNQEVKGHIRLKFKNHIILVADSFVRLFLLRVPHCSPNLEAFWQNVCGMKVNVVKVAKE